MITQADPMRWIWRGIAALTLVSGWAFILVHNKFNVTVPVIVIMLGYLAVVATLMNLWRVGAAAVAPQDAGEEAWTRPLGHKGELEKEKKTLLKAIKEAEFDHAMGKLSKSDVDQLIREYRGRAIEVIKELDRLEAGAAESPRERIKREVAARVAVEKAQPSKAQKEKAAKGKGKRKEEAKPDIKTTDDVETDDAVKTQADVKTTDEVETDPVSTPADDTEPKTTEATS